MKRVNLDIDDGYDFKQVEHDHWKIKTSFFEKIFIIGAPVWGVFLSNFVWGFSKYVINSQRPFDSANDLLIRHCDLHGICELHFQNEFRHLVHSSCEEH